MMARTIMNALVKRFAPAIAALALGLLGQNAQPAKTPDFRSPYLAVGLSPAAPAFRWFCVDALGGGQVDENPVLEEELPPAPLQFIAQADGTSASYIATDEDGRKIPVWTVSWSGRRISLASSYAAGTSIPPFILAFDQKANHATLLGRMKPGERLMSLPCVLHLPDRGSVRITADRPGQTVEYDARRYVERPFVRIAFPGATAGRPRVAYDLEVAAIHPSLPDAGRHSRYDGFRRSFLNIFQVNPRVQMLANNASSDPVPFTLYMDALVAAAAPPLAEGLTALDLVRMTLDRYLAGAKGYGLAGYAVEKGEADLVAWKATWNSLDTYPSLLQAACSYITASGDGDWARANFDKLAAWAREMTAADKNGNGLIEHPHTGNSGDRATADRRPSNWWDTINFGHEDAYSNALAYRACRQFSELASALGRTAEAKAYSDRAARLKAAFRPSFLNPATGLLAGWKSADGKLHDYAFTFVNGIAVAFGLLEPADANPVMDRLLQKMADAGFANFRLGLPGNLVPVRKEDYVFHNWDGARAVGEPFQDDGKDAFQIYENGGATACYAYFTIKALYELGRKDDARRLFYPMLESFAAGDFQGFCADGKSKDWRDWSGGCHGYEGLLTDGYLALLCVLDDLKAGR
jgi:hypothetical protein